MNAKALLNQLIKRIALPESADEIKQIALMVLEKEFGFSPASVLTEQNVIIDPDMHMRLDEIVLRLNRHEPVQYILGEAHFFGRTFNVNRSVLIPRPETEELVHEVLGQLRAGDQEKCDMKILDVGTGSGCIAITIKLEMPEAKVWATDISKEALRLAEQNAARLGADVQFLKHDVLSDEISLLDLDVIVSNPPYISHEEKSSMKKNVLNYEPHSALFVKGDDALLFYRALANQGKVALKHGGKIIAEVNEHAGTATSEIFSQAGYTEVTLAQDITMKDRIVSATWLPS